MVTIGKILGLLPKFGNKKELVTWRQSVNRLMKEIVKAHNDFKNDYYRIDSLFDTGDIYTTSQKLWEFCKYNLKYKEEGDDSQSVKSPAGILQPGETVDCKHYSLFIGGILDAISEYEGVDDWKWFYRFACYDSSKIPCHVFVVVKTIQGKEIWIDPVLDSFDRHKQPTHFIDERPMSGIGAIYKISGISEGDGLVVTTNKKSAEIGFLILVNANAFNLKNLFRGNWDITNGSFKNWYIDNGYDFDHFLRILKA